MSKTFNTTLVAGTNTYFDLHDYVHDITEAYVASHVASSVAWRIDTMLVANARSVFKAAREVLRAREIADTEWVDMPSLDANMDFHNALQQLFDDRAIAGATGEDPIDVILDLIGARDSWHAMAKELTSLREMDSLRGGKPAVYEAPELSAVFFAEPNLRVNATTQRRIAISSKRMADAYGLGEDGAKTFEQRRMQREEDNLKAQSLRLTEQAGTVYQTFQQVIHVGGDRDKATSFYAYTVGTQDKLLRHAIQAAQRADEWACKERGMSDMEYDRILACVMKVEQDIRKVLKGDRFVVAQRVAEAATI